MDRPPPFKAWSHEKIRHCQDFESTLVAGAIIIPLEIKKAMTLHAQFKPPFKTNRFPGIGRHYGPPGARFRKASAVRRGHRLPHRLVCHAQLAAGIHLPCADPGQNISSYPLLYFPARRTQ